MPERSNRKMKVTHSDDPDHPHPYRSSARSRQGVSFPATRTLTGKSPAQPEPVRVGERLYTLKETAQLLNTTERHVRGLWEQRKLVGIKVGKFLRFPESRINQFLADGTVEPL